ncbi:MAG: hypothetical protein AB1611_11460 [bacterium]
MRWQSRIQSWSGLILTKLSQSLISSVQAACCEGFEICSPAGCLLLFTLLILLPVSRIAEASHFQEVTPTPTWMYLSGLFTIDGQDAVTGDEVGVFDERGLLVGRTTVTVRGRYGVMKVYGDDPATSRHDGAIINSKLTLKFWKASSRTETIITRDDISLIIRGPFGPSDFPLRWTGHRDKYVVHVAAKEKATHVPLLSGWGGIAAAAFLLLVLTVYVERKIG